jgi:hypothetical protein
MIIGFLYVPKLKRSLLLYLALIVGTSPFVVGGYFFTQLGRHVYPSEADSIMIPIATFTVLVFPVAVVLSIGAILQHNSDVPIWTLQWQRPARTLIWSLLSIYAVYQIGSLFCDAFHLRSYIFALLFLLQIHALLLARAVIVSTVKGKPSGTVDISVRS